MNERIRGTLKVGDISKTVHKSRLNRYGHVMKREEEYVGKRVILMDVLGRRRNGRPKLIARGGNWSETLTPHKSWKRCRLIRRSNGQKTLLNFALNI